MQRIPEKYSAYWLGIAAVLSGIYYLALRSSRMLLGLDISPQNIQGFVILALLMSLAVIVGGFFGATIYSVTAFIFSVIGVAFLLIVAATETFHGWTDLISVVGFMFWGGMAIGGGIIVQLIFSIQASRKRLKEITAQAAETAQEYKEMEMDYRDLSDYMVPEDKTVPKEPENHESR